MLWITHILLGIFSLLIIHAYFPIGVPFAAVFLFATLLPDIDAADSLISRKTRPLSTVIQWLTKHRGLIHSLNFCARISLLLLIFASWTVVPFFLGYSLHLFADSFTKNGIRPLYPLKWKIHGAIRVGSLAEKFLMILVAIGNILLAISTW